MLKKVARHALAAAGLFLALAGIFRSPKRKPVAHSKPEA